MRRYLCHNLLVVPVLPYECHILLDLHDARNEQRRPCQLLYLFFELAGFLEVTVRQHACLKKLCAHVLVIDLQYLDLLQ